jgi:hypothetical protein
MGDNAIRDDHLLVQLLTQGRANTTKPFAGITTFAEA